MASSLKAYYYFLSPHLEALGIILFVFGINRFTTTYQVRIASYPALLGVSEVSCIYHLITFISYGKFSANLFQCHFCPILSETLCLGLQLYTFDFLSVSVSLSLFSNSSTSLILSLHNLLFDPSIKFLIAVIMFSSLYFPFHSLESSQFSTENGESSLLSL